MPAVPTMPPSTVPPKLRRAIRSGSKRRSVPYVVNAIEPRPANVGMIEMSITSGSS
jgi:hypothetical protein